MPAREVALKPGTHLGRYEITANIGEGGWASVYKARDTLLDRAVALKVVSKPLAAQFEEALRPATGLHHPHICSFYESYRDDELSWLAMEYVEGETLADRLGRGSISIEETLTFAMEIAGALAYAHELGVRHGALNPRNIVLGPGGIKLTDFGLAVDLFQRSPFVDTRNGVPFYTNLAAQKHWLETVRYLSPEQLNEKAVDAKGDVFAFGSILYEMALSRKAFEGETVEGLVTEILQTTPVIGSELLVWPDLAALVLECLQKDPAKRPPFSETCRALARVVETLHAPPGSSVLRKTKEPVVPLHFDENVQFTVYRPQTIAPGKWYSFLAFAHLSERRHDSPPNEPDPVREVERKAREILREATDEYCRVTEDSGQAVPREGSITFVPAVTGVQFNPPSRTFQWQEPVHCEEFRLRAQPSVDGRQARGRLSVFLGSILLAELSLSIRVDSGHQEASRTNVPSIDSVRPYRRIFASYSHKDEAIVSQFERYAGATGDEYLRDAITLRSGENWQQELCRLIEKADVFQLFWSWNSMASEFVRQEWEYALALRRNHFVRPVYWEEPLPAKEGLPPVTLRQLHFQRIPTVIAQVSPVVLISAPSPGREVPAADLPTLQLPSILIGGAQGTTRVEGLGSAQGSVREPLLKPPIYLPKPMPLPKVQSPDSSAFRNTAIVIGIAVLLAVLWLLM